MLAVKPQTAFDLEDFFGCLEGLSRIALAVSGGSDSLAMMHLVKAWADTCGQRPFITVLSVDHGLRLEAPEECARVARWCDDIGLPHVTLMWQEPKPRTGLQAKARQARYDLMTDWCLANDVPVLLTAHTADDQAETVVMRQSRTSSAKSLAGIWPERDWNGVRILRPLLSARRTELRNYLAAQHLPWIDDPSNVDRRFERVRVREQLAGDIGAAKIATISQRHVQDVEAVTEHWINSHLQIEETGLLRFSPKDFVELVHDVQDQILAALFHLSGITGLPDARKCRALSSWLSAAATGRRTLGGLVFAKRSRAVLVGREVTRISSDPAVLPQSGEMVWDGRFYVRGPAGATVRAAGEFNQIPRRRDIPAFLDAGLPVISLGRDVLAAPYHGIGAGVTCEFIGLKHKLWTWIP